MNMIYHRPVALSLLGWLTALILACADVCPLAAAHWPCWMGPLRNGCSPETGLLASWPKEGPKLLWKAAGGDGYSALVVAHGMAFAMVQHDGAAFVLALDAAKGTKLWETKVGGSYKNQWGHGPRSTPAINYKNIYVQLANGLLACLDMDKGNIVWSIDLLKEFSSKNITWGLSASPLVEGDLVYAIPGGKGAGVVALNKRTGQLVWKTGGDRPAYATPVPITVAGQKQIVFFTASGLLATNPENGKELWRVPWKTDFDCNNCTPLPIGKDLLFVTSGESVGCAMLKLSGTGPEVLWESKGKKSVMMNYWANSIAFEGHLYGVSGDCPSGASGEKKFALNCVDLNTGELKWSQKNFGKAAIIFVDGHLYMTAEKGRRRAGPRQPDKIRRKGTNDTTGR